MVCLGRFVSQTRGGITRCDYAQSGAALSHEKRSARPNSMSYGLKIYRNVRDAIAHLIFGRTSVTFHFKRSCGDFLCSCKLQVALTSLFIFFNKCTTNGPLRTGHKNVVSKFQRLRPRFMAANNRSDGTAICVKSEGPRSVNLRLVCTLYGVCLLYTSDAADE